MSIIRHQIDRDISLFDAIHPLVAKGRKVFCLTDEQVYEECYPSFRDALQLELEPICIPSGEVHKDLATCSSVWRTLMECGAERDSLLIALGGGVVTDLGGFVGTTYLRGMSFLFVPTTLLGMVDAAIGGKNGVDLDGYKNMVGSVRQPEKVLVHPPFLRSLDFRQKRSGLAEMIKHAVLEGKELFQRVEWLDLEDEKALESLLPDLIEVKRSFVGSNPNEKGERECLNFGHTVGHALETLSMEADDPLLHGEVVAAGMIVEAFISMDIMGLPEDECKRLVDLLFERFGKVDLPDEDELIRVMEKDKKIRQGKIHMVLLERIGKPIHGCLVERSSIERGLRSYGERG